MEIKTDPVRGGGIATRADLIQALTVASQFEHALMLQYLYAAFSMKAFAQEFDPGAKTLSPTDEVRRHMLRDWEASILRVARQEMEHLGFVCNLLAVIGGNQYFDRPNFPQSPLYWQVDLPIELEAFNITTLLRFLSYEKPEKLDDHEVDVYRHFYGGDFKDYQTAEKDLERLRKAALKTAPKETAQPTEPRYTSLGNLYEQIRDAFESLPDLFIVPPDGQVDNNTLFGDGSLARPIYEIYLFKTYDRQSALNAINEIIEQGEGTMHEGRVTPDQLDPTCHYMLFRKVLQDYTAGFKSKKPIFQGARNCVRNPAFEQHPDTAALQAYHGVESVQPAMSVAIINHPWTRQVLAVSNAGYESLMQMLVRLYTASGDTSVEVQGLVNTAFFPMMTMVIRPMAELVSLLPAFRDNPHGLTAGSGFEFFRTIGFLPHKPAAWLTIHERLVQNAESFREALANMPDDIRKLLVASGYEPDVALPFIAQNLHRIASNFKSYMKI